MIFEAAVAALFGLLIGSFLNVCIYRMPRDLSVVRPRSFCPSCEKQVEWYDNIPVVSFILLRGGCRNCRASIPLRYPAVELLNGGLFFLGVLMLGPTLAALKFCIFAAIMVALIFMDLEERILADEFTLGGTAVGVILAYFVPIPQSLIAFFLPYDWGPRWHSVAESFFGAVALAGMLWSIAKVYEMVRKREGMGFGDVKMVACIGAFVGLAPALMTVIVGSVLGSVTGVLYIWFSKKDAATYELPFGSFLGIAALLTAIAGLWG